MNNKNIKTKYLRNMIVSTMSFAIMFSAFVAPVSVDIKPHNTMLAKVSLKTNKADADRKSITSKLRRPSSKPSSSNKKSSSSTPRGGTASNNKYAKKSLSGDCKKVAGKCVVFSKSGCNNFYINGRHYGGSKSCSILKRNCPRPVQPPVVRRPNPSTPITNPNRPVVADTNRAADDTDVPMNTCTPGVDCPPGDLGPVITQSTVSPIFANDRNQCTLNWVATTNSPDVRVLCTLKSNGGATTTASTSPSIIPVGTTVLNCRREIQNADDQWVLYDQDSKEVGCRQNPAFIER
jgi:hypothetical protein